MKPNRKVWMIAALGATVVSFAPLLTSAQVSPAARPGDTTVTSTERVYPQRHHNYGLWGLAGLLGLLGLGGRKRDESYRYTNRTGATTVAEDSRDARDL